MSGKYTEFEKQANGNLRIVLLPEARDDVQEISSKEIDADNKLSEVIEWQLANGWSLLHPEDVGALTDAPILSEDIDTDDQGNVRSVGTVYWYPQYDVSNPVAKLLQNGLHRFCTWGLIGRREGANRDRDTPLIIAAGQQVTHPVSYAAAVDRSCYTPGVAGEAQVDYCR